MNNSEFKYKIVDHTIIIEKCPNDVLTCDLIIQLDHYARKAEKFYLNEGIKEIGESVFAGYDYMNSIRLPNTLKKIDNNAFYHCSGLKEIIIPESVEYIGAYAFSDCYSLERVVIPDNVKQIDRRTFSKCIRLKDITLPSNLESIGSYAFEDCNCLLHIQLPRNLKYIRDGAFWRCRELKEITIPEGVTELNKTFNSCKNLSRVVLPRSLKKIGYLTFNQCSSLNSVEFSEGLEVIGEKAFYECSGLKEIMLPNTLKVIGNSAFFGSGLVSISIPDSVEIIDNDAFFANLFLLEVEIGKGLKKVGESCFKHCEEVRKVKFNGPTKEIGKEAFCWCGKLENIHLPRGLEKIERELFCGCKGLNKIEIPEGVKEIQEDVFYSCEELQEIKFPSTLDVFSEKAITYCSNLQKIILNDKGEQKEININSLMFMRNQTKKLFIYDSYSRKTLGFYNEGEYVTFDEELITKNSAIKQMMKDGKINSDNFVSLYYWLNKKFIPSHIVIKNMPLKDIDNFFINKNYVEWSKLLKDYHIYYDENKTSFFKLCYVLGVFSESTSVRDRAVKFLNEKIVNVLDADDIHSRFDGFDLNNGFNEEYAEFFIKYYDGKNFMTIKFGSNSYIDLMAASYNNFKQVKKVYPNKTIHTNREADLLLPVHVMDAIRTISYEDVDEGNEEFSKVIGRYGYTQEQFKILQDWYTKGKQIKEMKLFVSEDKEEKGITYNLLSKNDPLNAILGNITNCCQVIAGAGQSCVEYGMTMPNSGFITFNYKGKIIGQAWVWYDEESKTICLDNIEIPHRYLEKIHQNKTIQNSFVECLLRIEKSFKEEMNKRGLEVDKVTIGEGYNDIKEILDKNFQLLKYHNFLNGYGGYTDSSKQYEISDRKLVK